MTKILIIEDERGLRDDLVELLSLEGYEVISASDGIDGINTAVRTQPDLIICDIMMPRLDGYRVLLDLRANSVTQFTPFIFLTAKSAQDEMRRGMELGADDYVTKPFGHLDLSRAVQMRLDKKAAQEHELQQQTDVFRSALAYERQQRLLKERLVAMFSDDFPLPLESILSSNSLLRDYSNEMDATDRAAHFSRIEASAHELQRILDDVLLVAQLESGGLQLKPELLHVGSFVGRILDEHRAIYGEAYRLLWECRSSQVMLADARLIRQISTNLIASSIRHSPKGSTIHVSLVDQDGQYLLTVRDEINDAAPTPVSSANDFVEVGFASDEIGREIVAQMVEVYGGTFILQRQPGVGTTVTVTLPPL